MNESRNHTATVEWGYEANFLSLSSFLIEETLTHGVQCTKAPVNKSESSAIRGNEQTSKHIWQVWKRTSRRMHAAFAMAIN